MTDWPSLLGVFAREYGPLGLMALLTAAAVGALVRTVQMAERVGTSVDRLEALLRADVMPLLTREVEERHVQSQATRTLAEEIRTLTGAVRESDRDRRDLLLAMFAQRRLDDPR